MVIEDVILCTLIVICVYVTDIAAGAYKSGHAIVLKTSPIIRYEANITTDVSSIGFNATSFKIKTCLTYKGENVPPKVGKFISIYKYYSLLTLKYILS